LKAFANAILKNQKRWGIPILLTLLGVLILYRGLAQYKRKLGYNMEVRNALISSREMPQGHIISDSDLTHTQVPKKYVPIGALLRSDANKIIGQMVSRPMGKGEMILWSAIDISLGPSSPSKRVTKGYRAISIQVDAKSSVGQWIRPGDHVDIIATMHLPGKNTPTTLHLLQNVSVISVGTLASNPAIESYSTLSLMVLPKEVGIILHAEKQGQIQLALRNPEDYKTSKDLPMVSIHQLIETAFRNSIQDERNHSIEIIRGGKLSTPSIP